MKSRGFTLIELSIVLVIVGLITAGIMTGQSLIRQSQLNSVMVDVQRYVTAAKNFKDKYNALPGDFATATSYWSGVGNGNGNGQLDQGATEPLYFWQHLSSAQLIPGSYTGAAGSGGASDHVPGVNCPASRVEGAGFSILYQGVTSGDASWYDGAYGHAMAFGTHSNNSWTVNSALTTAEALAMDTKYDDGMPATGSIVTYKPSVLPNCATSAASSATYKTASSGLQCSLWFVTGF